MTTATETKAVNVRTDEFDVYVGRCCNRARDPRCRIGSEFANHYSMAEHTRSDAIEKYRKWLHWKFNADPDFRTRLLALKGKRLGCWCKPKACHADVLVELIEELAK